MKSPILFLVFNRPETTRQVFAAIRSAQPPRLYIAADGPRVGRASDRALCDEVRRIATAVDWPCEVKTLFRSANLGCRIGVSAGISWFFEHEPEGVILEDDVVPIASFFAFCDELLARYRNDGRVSMISGSNFVSDRFHVAESYFFSRFCSVWGWASWRRAWRRYDVNIPAWPEWRDAAGLKRLAEGNSLFEFYWRYKFDACHGGKEDTWDYQWTFTCWLMGGLSVVPSSNQIHNIGFSGEATHTTTGTPDYVIDSPVVPLTFPLRHPDTVVRQAKADALIDSRVYGINVADFFRRGLRRARRALIARRVSTRDEKPR